MKILFKILVLVSFVFANQMTDYITNDVLIKDSKALTKSIDLMLSNTKNADLKSLRQEFKTLVYAWKKVEAIYVAGELDDMALDLARLIDIYHEGNENIKEQLKRIMQNTKPLKTQLFKNSHKTINALEFVLFESDKLDKRKQEMAVEILKSLRNNSQEITKTYETNKDKLQDDKFTNSIILNALIQSSYKAQNWRLGEALGFEKYKKIDKNRLEYPLSKSSVNALLGILTAHKETLNSPTKDDLGDMASRNGAKEYIAQIRKDLDKAIEILNSSTELDLIGKKGVELHKIIKKIYLNYTIYVLDALSVTAKIIEADGD